MVLFKENKFVITSVTKMFIKPNPFCNIKKSFRREGPALQVEQLLFVPVAFTHEILVSADPLNFYNGGLNLINPEHSALRANLINL